MITPRCMGKVLRNLEDPLADHLVPVTAAFGECYVSLIPIEIDQLFMFVQKPTLLTLALPADEVRYILPLARER